MGTPERRPRLRDFLAGRRKAPPADRSDPADLLAEATGSDEIDEVEIARDCARSNARLWGRAERMYEEENRGGRK